MELPRLLLLLACADPPPFMLDRPALDFGAVTRHARRETVVRLTGGARPLQCKTTEADCVCLQSRVAAQRLEPGQTAAWTVTLETCDSLGEVRRSVWLNTDGEPIRLPVRYHVVPELFVEPGFVSLGLFGDVPAETVFAVRTLEAEPIVVLDAACDDPNLDVQVLRETVTRDQPGQVWVRAQPRSSSSEPLDATLWLTTSCPDLPRLRVPVRAEPLAGLRCDRQLVRFDAVPLGTAQTQVVVFHCAAGVEIGGVRASDDAVDAVALTRGAGQATLTLRSNPRRPLGAFQGFLLLEVRAGGQGRTARLPYWGQVVEAKQPAPTGAAP